MPRMLDTLDLLARASLLNVTATRSILRGEDVAPVVDRYCAAMRKILLLLSVSEDGEVALAESRERDTLPAPAPTSSTHIPAASKWSTGT